MSRPTLHLISLGCTKNLVDSEVMLGKLKDCSIIDSLSQADIVIINTCGFIQSAKQESIQTILNAANNKKKDALLVVSGCLSERYSDELLSQMPEIDVLIGVRDYDKIDMFLEQKGFKLESKPLPKLESSLAPNHRSSARLKDSKALPHIRNFATNDKVFLADETNARVITGSRIHAYIKLSEGCNQSCSFCAIPSFKGKLRSRSIESIVKEVENLAKQGFRDFSFIAQDSSSYLRDFGIKDGLVALIKALESQDIIQNARIHYLYPTTTTPKLIETIAQSRIIQNYFDMPIQHIADSMLKRMRRGAGQKELLALLRLIKNVQGAFVRSTIIVGHPNESEEEFAQLCDFIQEGIFDRLNLFAFSSEEGTLADSMPNKIPSRIINKRLNALNKILKAQDKIRYNALKGQNLEVIVDGRSKISEFFYSARERKWGVEIDGEILINDSEIENITSGFYQAKITDYKQGMLFGTILKRLDS